MNLTSMNLTRRSLLSILVSAAMVFPLLGQSAFADQKHVAITQIVEHPALDAVHKGVKDELAAQGYIEGQNLKLSLTPFILNV